MTKKNIEYGDGLAKLEKIVDSLEDNELELDKMVSLVEEGLELAEQLKKHLESAENKVQKLKQKYQLDKGDANEMV